MSYRSWVIGKAGPGPLNEIMPPQTPCPYFRRGTLNMPFVPTMLAFKTKHASKGMETENHGTLDLLSLLSCPVTVALLELLDKTKKPIVVVHTEDLHVFAARLLLWLSSSTWIQCSMHSRA